MNVAPKNPFSLRKRVSNSLTGMIIMKIKVSYFRLPKSQRLRKSKQMALKRQQGFTLIEAMVTLSILLIIISSTLGLFTTGYRNLATPKNLTAATNIARTKMEEIKNTSFGSITTSFPAGDYPVEGSLLPEGTILNISYPDGVVDPLAVSVTVSWPEGDNWRSIELATLVTPL